MCDKVKGCNSRIDKCMRSFMEHLGISLQEGIRVVACCCGHKKYPMTIVIKSYVWMSESYEYYDLVSGEIISRTRRFYKKDKKGFYYIPEAVKNA